MPAGKVEPVSPVGDEVAQLNQETARLQQEMAHASKNNTSEHRQEQVMSKA